MQLILEFYYALGKTDKEDILRPIPHIDSREEDLMLAHRLTIIFKNGHFYQVKLNDCSNGVLHRGDIELMPLIKKEVDRLACSEVHDIYSMAESYFKNKNMEAKGSA